MNTSIRVGMAEYKAAKSPYSLITLGLGSCVGVTLYDNLTKVGGLAHVMLPDSTLSGKKDYNPGKFADTAIDVLIEEMLRLGASKNRMVSKIAGGAQMFQIKSENNIMQIGKRNVEAVRNKLNQLNIRIIAEDVEGNYGRTIEFFCEDGRLAVRTIGHGTRIL
ncbi:putative chemoreceptor glutamine deamidase CheD [Tepidanaerobacter syntrophicus]|nr:chemotaxis protein CheD [Tepidanaerobacter syntrophicus]GLI19219.1 putative chemoreceptor glutamine deamidase CheD [Tepidanaerobacter syntrophicus]GLI50148.1 putative chemoreceptor glutamine deamidase CheD [Tepidanaerobacter syntrophicus]